MSRLSFISVCDWNERNTLPRVCVEFALSFWSLDKLVISPLSPITSVCFFPILLYRSKSFCFSHIIRFRTWLKALRNDGDLEEELLGSTNSSILIMERLDFSKSHLSFFPSQVEFLSRCKNECRHTPLSAGILSTCQDTDALAWFRTRRRACPTLPAVYSTNPTSQDLLRRQSLRRANQTLLKAPGSQ